MLYKILECIAACNQSQYHRLGLFPTAPAAKTKGVLDSPSFEGMLKASFLLEDCNDFSASDDRSVRSACG